MKYTAASANPIGHQTAAYASDLGPAATSYAVRAFSGAQCGLQRDRKERRRAGGQQAGKQ